MGVCRQIVSFTGSDSALNGVNRNVMANWTGSQVNEFVKKWREPVEALLRETEALVVESCQGLISHNVKGTLATRFKAEVSPMLEHPCTQSLQSVSGQRTTAD